MKKKTEKLQIKIDLNQLFEDASREMKSKFDSIKKNICHPSTKGGTNEDIWINWLREYMPRRYEVNRGVIIDSKGYQSRQEDIVIFDHQYTPLIYQQQNTLFIPIEAVYAVIEAKTTLTAKEIKDAGEKIASIRNLYRSPTQHIKYARGQYPPKKHGHIYGYVVASIMEWKKTPWKYVAKYLPNNKLQFIDGGCIMNSGTFASKFKKNYILLKRTTKTQALFGFLGLLFEDIKSLATVPAWDLGRYASFIKDICVTRK
ncbi:MAG: DUF6602 domain-containing protein [bacterium]